MEKRVACEPEKLKFIATQESILRPPPCPGCTPYRRKVEIEEEKKRKKRICIRKGKIHE